MREPYPAKAVDDLVIQAVGSDAHLYWSPVTQDTMGQPLCPHVYLIFFEDDLSEDPDFLAYTEDTSYVHYGVAQFSQQMFYQVDTYIGEVGLLSSAVAEFGDHCKRSALFRLFATKSHEIGREGGEARHIKID